MTNYLKMFFNEKDIPLAQWALTATDGTTHFIDSEVVIEHIKATSTGEQNQIGNVLRKIDFMNGDVNHFLKHLAQGLVNNY